MIKYTLPSIYGRVEYFAAESGQLIGVTEWHDTTQSCGLFRDSDSFVYGEIPDCSGICVLDAACITDVCTESVETTPACN
jgi:hypothetical protein